MKTTTYEGMMATFFSDQEYMSIDFGTRDAMARWALYGIKPGSFLQAVIENNLLLALLRADPNNRKCIYWIMKWFYNHAPAACFSTPDALKSWKGLNGGKRWIITYEAGMPGETRRPMENQLDGEPMEFESPEDAAREIERVRELHTRAPECTSGFVRFLMTARVEEMKQ